MSTQNNKTFEEQLNVLHDLYPESINRDAPGTLEYRFIDEKQQHTINKILPLLTGYDYETVRKMLTYCCATVKQQAIYLGDTGNRPRV